MIRTNRHIESTPPARASAAGGVAFLISTLLLSGCGGDPPTRDEFIAEMRETLGSDLATGEGLDVDTGALQELVDDFLGCTYDAIRDDADLMAQMMRDPSFSSATTDRGTEQQARLGELTQHCTEALNSAATEVSSGEE